MVQSQGINKRMNLYFFILPHESVFFLSTPCSHLSLSLSFLPILTEEAMLKEELETLSTELREVKEARHMLRAVRSEAAQAIHAVR
jgi:hypothetical protein